MRKIDFTNEFFPVKDRELYNKMQGQFLSEEEQTFFDEMVCKELYDCPISTFDVIMHEDDNDEHLYIQKEYNSEYVVGRFFENGKCVALDEHPLCLAELVDTDLFPLLGRHITVLEWLRARTYCGINYNYPWED